MTAAVADHKHDVYYSCGTHRDRRVQVDHHAARAVRIDRIGPLFLPFRCEIFLVHRAKAVAYVISLTEVAVTVKNLNTCYNLWQSVVGNPEGVFALSVAFEQPKSSVPPARATPLSAGNVIAAASIPRKSQLFILVLPSD